MESGKSMELIIKKLTSELVEDYINFFDRVAFTDNEEWAGCYCVFYHWNEKLEEECRKCANEDRLSFRRNLAMQYISEGKLQGYLAYTEGAVVGWCNTNDKRNYDALSPTKRPELWDENTDQEKVKLIVCYTIAPMMRQKGIATRLLEQVCLDAKAEGYSYIEAFPGKDERNMQRNYHGPYALYKKCGFQLVRELEGDIVVRKNLI